MTDIRSSRDPRKLLFFAQPVHTWVVRYTRYSDDHESVDTTRRVLTLRIDDDNFRPYLLAATREAAASGVAALQPPQRMTNVAHGFRVSGAAAGKSTTRMTWSTPDSRHRHC